MPDLEVVSYISPSKRFNHRCFLGAKLHSLNLISIIQSNSKHNNYQRIRKTRLNSPPGHVCQWKVPQRFPAPVIKGSLFPPRCRWPTWLIFRYVPGQQWQRQQRQQIAMYCGHTCRAWLNDWHSCDLPPPLAGWRTVLGTDVIVGHRTAVSFVSHLDEWLQRKSPMCTKKAL